HIQQQILRSLRSVRMTTYWTSLMTLRSCLTAIALAALPAVTQAQKQVVAVPGANPSAMLSAGVKIGDLLHLSGQLPARGDSTIESFSRERLPRSRVFFCPALVIQTIASPTMRSAARTAPRAAITGSVAT